MLKEFKDFVARGNVFDLSIGVVIYQFHSLYPVMLFLHIDYGRLMFAMNYYLIVLSVDFVIY